MHQDPGKVSFRSSIYLCLHSKCFFFGYAFRLTFEFRKAEKNPKSHYDYLVGMHLTIYIWTLQKSVAVHQNIRNLTLKMYLIGNTYRPTFEFRKIEKNPKSHHDYFVGMHPITCIWILERSVSVHQNIPMFTFKMFLFGYAFRVTFEFRNTEKNPKSHHDYLVGMHPTLWIWILERSVSVHQNIPMSTFEMYLIGNAFRLTFEFRKTEKNPTFHHHYLVAMHLIICIWTLQRSVAVHRNIRSLACI